MTKRNVVINILGVIKDAKGRGHKRWHAWRPTISLVSHPEFPVDRMEMLYEPDYLRLAKRVMEDVQQVSPHTQVALVETAWSDPWDFADVYSWLLEFSQHYNFDTDNENYYLNITTGTHVNQICMFLLSEAQLFPARLVQVSPDFNAPPEEKSKGILRVIDLDLSKYDALSQRFQQQAQAGTEFLKAGIQTRDIAFNQMIEEIEQVAISSRDTILLQGPTGAGKSQLARRIYELKATRKEVTASFVPVNCATLVGEGAMSALFGHVKGAFTGAINPRSGYLKQADKGVLFLDEIGELGLDEQAMLLHAIESKEFYPVGADSLVYSDFQLIAGTNKDLQEEVKQGRFREDLLARIDIWSWRLPSLKQRMDDFEVNLEFELHQSARLLDRHIRFSMAAKEQYLSFAKSPSATWAANFRDLNASVTRMATLSPSGRIERNTVEREIQRLQNRWQQQIENKQVDLTEWLDKEVIEELDYFDQMQLQSVIQACKQYTTAAEASRALFDKSRLRKQTQNDSHRLRMYLQKFGLTFKQIKNS
ncbi:RNA repair transcriptional activator RtcR [Alteromonas sp. ASW11-36]|uniref:RNA repair transcriptional activator RtcR n=1 Tax=Alteromonas arenosi TaxID=3055817 RepID=A0ABT7SWZ6_9ALTE|nr:RNA repair transcriptional activator RtcR [Alteromonas sp. ASW11-36]MDM7860524.1 RNA repair transcriptional activator RtcR [Alteromonas sp. ASW11-36]